MTASVGDERLRLLAPALRSARLNQPVAMRPVPRRQSGGVDGDHDGTHRLPVLPRSVDHEGRPLWPLLDAMQPVLAFAERGDRIPANTNRVEMWFRNTDQSGCSAWDSRYGLNCSFDVA